MATAGEAVGEPTGATTTYGFWARHGISVARRACRPRRPFEAADCRPRTPGRRSVAAALRRPEVGSGCPTAPPVAALPPGCCRSNRHTPDGFVRASHLAPTRDGSKHG